MSSSLFADVDENEKIFDESQQKKSSPEVDQPVSPFTKSLHAPLLKGDEGDFMESIQSSLSDHSRSCLRSESKASEGEGVGCEVTSKTEEEKEEGHTELTGSVEGSTSINKDGNTSLESSTMESSQEVNENIKSDQQQEIPRMFLISMPG